MKLKAKNLKKLKELALGWPLTLLNQLFIYSQNYISEDEQKSSQIKDIENFVSQSALIAKNNINS